MGDNTNQLVYILSKLILFDIASVSFPVVLHWNERGKLAGRWEWTEFYYWRSGKHNTCLMSTNIGNPRLLAAQEFCSIHRRSDSTSATSTAVNRLHEFTARTSYEIDWSWDLRSEFWILNSYSPHDARSHAPPTTTEANTLHPSGRPAGLVVLHPFQPTHHPFCFHK